MTDELYLKARMIKGEMDSILERIREINNCESIVITCKVDGIFSNTVPDDEIKDAMLDAYTKKLERLRLEFAELKED